jgi:ABC-type spermidine/putrescine transport system permease subunit II
LRGARAYGTIDWTLGLANYARAFQPLYLEVYWRSFWMALITTALCALLGFPVAYTLALRISARWKSALLMLVVIPFWTSFLIRTYAWMIILRSEGVVNNTLLALHLVHEPLRLLYTPWAVMIGLVYGELPFMILPLYAVLQKLDPTLLEAAQDLGAPWWPTFLRITLPLSAPGLRGGIHPGVHRVRRRLRHPGFVGWRSHHDGGEPHPEPVCRGARSTLRLGGGVSLDVCGPGVGGGGVTEERTHQRGDVLMAGARRGGWGLSITTTAVYLFLYAPIFVLMVLFLQPLSVVGSLDGFHR